MTETIVVDVSDNMNDWITVLKKNLSDNLLGQLAWNPSKDEVISNQTFILHVMALTLL